MGLRRDHPRTNCAAVVRKQNRKPQDAGDTQKRGQHGTARPHGPIARSNCIATPSQRAPATRDDKRRFLLASQFLIDQSAQVSAEVGSTPRKMISQMLSRAAS